MSGVSIGWFDPTVFHPRPDELATAIAKLSQKSMRQSVGFPEVVSELRTPEREDAQVAYVAMGGALPVHVDEPADLGEPLPTFYFVLSVENRPTLISAPETIDTTPLFAGYIAPQDRRPFSMGCVELRVGMAVHFDATATWHGFFGMPVPRVAGVDNRPRATIIKVTGHPREDIEGAVLRASHWIGLDMAAGQGPKP